MLISHAADQFCFQRKAEGFSPYTLDRYALQIRLLIRAIGDRPVTEITLVDLREYVGGPECAHLKPSSVAHRIRSLRSFFSWLFEEEYIPKSPMKKIKEPKLPERIPKALPFEDLELVRDACQSAREHVIVELLFATGGRAAEVTNIKVQDVDFSSCAIMVIGKGNREREVYYGTRASLWLKRYLEARKDDCPYIMVTERGPARQLTTHQLWSIVKVIAARVGLAEKVFPHAFRHTFGTYMLNQGADIDVVGDLMGHVKTETTRIYARRSGANRRANFRRFFVQ